MVFRGCVPALQYPRYGNRWSRSICQFINAACPDITLILIMLSFATIRLAFLYVASIHPTDCKSQLTLEFTCFWLWYWYQEDSVLVPHYWNYVIDAWTCRLYFWSGPSYRWSSPKWGSEFKREGRSWRVCRSLNPATTSSGSTGPASSSISSISFSFR